MTFFKVASPTSIEFLKSKASSFNSLLNFAWDIKKVSYLAIIEVDSSSLDTGCSHPITSYASYVGALVISCWPSTYENIFSNLESFKPSISILCKLSSDTPRPKFIQGRVTWLSTLKVSWWLVSCTCKKGGAILHLILCCCCCGGGGKNSLPYRCGVLGLWVPTKKE